MVNSWSHDLFFEWVTCLSNKPCGKTSLSHSLREEPSQKQSCLNHILYIYICLRFWLCAASRSFAHLQNTGEMLSRQKLEQHSLLNLCISPKKKSCSQLLTWHAALVLEEVEKSLPTVLFWWWFTVLSFWVGRGHLEFKLEHLSKKNNLTCKFWVHKNGMVKAKKQPNIVGWKVLKSNPYYHMSMHWK